MNLYLRLRDFNRIGNIASITHPIECCGLLLGFNSSDTIHITQTIPLWNTSKIRKNYFEIDPSVHFSTLKRIRNKTLRLVGYYHSHPNRKLYPSTTDFTTTFMQDLVCLIITIPNGKFSTMAAYYLSKTGVAISVTITMI